MCIALSFSPIKWSSSLWILCQSVFYAFSPVLCFSHQCPGLGSHHNYLYVLLKRPLNWPSFQFHPVSFSSFTDSQDIIQTLYPWPTYSSSQCSVFFNLSHMQHMVHSHHDTLFPEFNRWYIIYNCTFNPPFKMNFHSLLATPTNVLYFLVNAYCQIMWLLLIPFLDLYKVLACFPIIYLIYP